MTGILSPLSLYIFSAIVAVSVGASLLGAFMILRRMALVADAFSHLALPGIAAGLLLGFSPFLGTLALLVFGFFMMAHFELTRRTHPETTLGVMFTTALAIGALLIPEHEIIESLFGSVEKLTVFSSILTVFGGLAIATLVFWQFRNFTLLTISAELAQASDVSVSRTNYLFFFTLALTVALGIQFVGILLVGALIVLPAAAAKNFSASFRSMTYLAVILGAIGAVVGLFLSARIGALPGPMIVITLAAVFVLSLFIKKRI